MNTTSRAVAEQRRWHVSGAHLPSGEGRDDRIGVDSDDERAADDEWAHSGEPTGQTIGVTNELAPLWYRIVTGKSFAWRVRWVRNRLRWARRGAARRALRWLDVHPEIRHAARTGEFGELLGSLRRRRRNSGGRGTPTYRARVDIGAHVSVDASANLLVAGVDVRTDPDTRSLATTGTPSVVTVAVTSGDEALLAASGPTGTVGRVLPPVDLRRWNPSRFQARPSTGPVWMRRLVAGDDERRGRRRLVVAHRAQAVECGIDPKYTSEAAARMIVELAVAGVPMVGDLSETTIDLIGPQLADLIVGADLDDLDDDHVRELHALAIRRAALERHSPRGWWQSNGPRVGVEVHAAPSVSVVLPSNRPGDVLDAARQVADQIGVEVQLVVGLHGAHMPASLDDELAEIFDGHLVVRRLDDDLNLGQVMNELTAFTDGDLVSKWDDDDWYDPHHLADLAWAMEYSGASMVGKAAEFVYLETLDLTIRRFASGCERMSTTIAGGTLMMTRDDLGQIGWADVPRQVDRRLIDAVEARGLNVYRTHGFGYVLRRRSAAMAQHTWLAGDEYFLRQSSDQRAGLDLEFAGFRTEIEA